MFKWNELSDLLDGTLVTPLSKTDSGNILCLNEDGTQSEYSYDDFDFEKTIDERSETTVSEVVDTMDSDSDDAEIDGSETLETEEKNAEKPEYKEGFCLNPTLIKKLGFSQGICYLDIV